MLNERLAFAVKDQVEISKRLSCLNSLIRTAINNVIKSIQNTFGNSGKSKENIQQQERTLNLAHEPRLTTSENSAEPNLSVTIAPEINYMSNSFHSQLTQPSSNQTNAFPQTPPNSPHYNHSNQEINEYQAQALPSQLYSTKFQPISTISTTILLISPAKLSTSTTWSAISITTISIPNTSVQPTTSIFTAKPNAPIPSIPASSKLRLQL